MVAWLIDAGFLVGGIISGRVATLMKSAVKLELKKAIKGMTKKVAIML